MDIEKLKQKVLDLAIRGKLVPQDPDDEPASVLIDKIRAEKEKLIKEGKIKRDKNESYIYKGSDNCYYENNEKIDISFDLPNGWEICKFRTVIDVRDGTHDSPKYQESGIPFVTSKNLKKDMIDFSTCKFISSENATKFNKRSNVDNYDILFAMIGTIGNPIIVIKDREFAIKNVALFKNINRNLLSEEWVKIILEALTNKMIEETSSGLQPFVSLDFLRNYIIPIPPYNEQIRIVKKVKNLFSIMNLIENDSLDLERYVEKAKIKILELYFGENSCYKSYYKKIPIKDVCLLEKKRESESGTLPYLEAKVIRGTKKPNIVNRGIFIKSKTKIILVDGENSGEIMIAPCDGYMGSTFRIIKTDESIINSDYLSYFIYLHKKVLKNNKTGSATPHLNKKIFNQLEIILPPIDKQIEICYKLSCIFNILDRLS